MFSANIYIERRRRLKERVKSGLILFLGNEESPMNYTDNAYPFRQDSSFLYFFGLDSPGLVAAIDVDTNQEIVFGNDLTVDDIIWTGPKPALKERCLDIGVSDTHSLNVLQELLQKSLHKSRTLHFLPQYKPENILKIQSWLGFSPADISRCASVELIKAVVALRSIKSAEEIQEIETALDITYEMHTAAMATAKPGAYEREVAGRMEGIALSHGGRLAFPTIFSIHGETLHNHDHGNRMKAGDMAVNDSGAETSLHYPGDITRTIPIGGKFSTRQREIYSVVLNTQENVIQAIQPAVEYRNVHRLACQTIAAGLKDLGLMKGDVKEAVASGAHTLFFPHGIGHMLGLDVHDMESLGEDYVGYTDTIRRNTAFGWKSLRLGRALEPGFVVTVEPGIYFIPELIDRWKAERKCSDFIDYEKVETYRDFGGIRIEEDILVEAQGGRILGKRIPKSLEGVEELASRK